MKKIYFSLLISFMFYTIGHILWTLSTIYGGLFKSSSLDYAIINIPFGLFGLLGMYACFKLYKSKS